MRYIVLTFALLAGELATAEVADRHLAWWVQQRLNTLEARFARRPFDQIGWVGDLEQAMALAQQHNRPIFLFSYDGLEIDTGRC